MTANARRLAREQTGSIEWITLGLILACYLVWAFALFVLTGLSLWLAVPALTLSLVLHASLSHEVCHGHPLPSRRASEMLVMFNPGLAVPFLRFRDTHLAHHQDSLLTDPYDDPESNYLDPANWDRMPAWLRGVRHLNNTLAGRMLLGPVLGQASFMAGDIAAIRAGDGQVLRAWLLHVPGVALTLGLAAVSTMPIWLYLACAYAAFSILKVRTFLEHQAHERARGRTVIIEDRGLLAFLFLNNNLHVVHHMHPKVPWYRLPATYLANKDKYLRANDGYMYQSYREIFARHFLRAKDPVAHPLWPSPPK